jgi:hypothetical protein
VKSKIKSLLGIEMSLKGYEFKPIMLILGILLFIGLSIPLLLAYGCLYIKYTLLNIINNIKKNNKYYTNRPLKRV